MPQGLIADGFVRVSDAGGVVTKTMHVFRPGLFRRERTYWLDSDRLRWLARRGEGSVLLADIVALRLCMPEDGAAGASCVIRTREGGRHVLRDRHRMGWRVDERHRFGRREQRLNTFRGLVFPLARRLAKINPDARLAAGIGRPMWLAALAVLAAAVGVIAVGAWLMLASGTWSLAALGFMAVVATGLPVLWQVVRRGASRPLDPASLIL